MSGELKAIIGLLEQAGTGAVYCFIIYMAVKYVLFTAVLLSGLAFIAKAIFAGIAKLVNGVVGEDVLMDWRNKLGLGSGYLSVAEKRRTILEIHRLVDEAASKRKTQ